MSKETMQEDAMQKGFTLIELIFAIVIIGVLAAVAVPQFTDLKKNAEISAVTQAISALQSSGKTSYLNQTELNGVSSSELNVTNLVKFDGKGWNKSSDEKKAWYSASDGTNDINVSFTYNDGGTVTVNIENPSTPTDLREKLENQTGLEFDDSDNNATIDLN